MELRHLRYFSALAETRSFTRAAEQLRVSQPTLSHQIRQLESLLGTVLFDRVARGVELTSAGRTFRPYCDRTLREMESGILAISELEGLMRGTLRMAVLNSFSNSLLGPVLARFVVEYPGVHTVARLLPRQEMERELLSGALDLSVAYASEDTEHIVAEKLFEEELVLVVASKHPLATETQVQMRDLRKLDLVLLTQEFAARQYVDRFFARTAMDPHVVLEMNAVEPILATVRQSTLATVLSSGAVGESKELRRIRLTDPTPMRSVAILWHRLGHRSAAAVRMAAMIRSAYVDVGKLPEKKNRHLRSA